MTNEDFIYDETESIEYIRNFLPQELKDKFTDDEITYIVDVVYDFYESKDLLNDDADEEADVEIDEDELIAYVVKNARKDKMGQFEAEDIAFVVQGELSYCESIDMFEDE